MTASSSRPIRSAPRPGAGTGVIQSVRRALQLLKAFDREHPEWSVADLCTRFGYQHRSTVSRLMSTLAAEGLVQWNPRTNRYRLGFVLLDLAGVLQEQIDVRAAAQPAMQDLCRLTGETVSLDVLEGTETIVIDQVTSPSSVRYVCWLGRRVPAHASSAGKVLLAFQPDDVVEPLLQRMAEPDGRLPGYTERTLPHLAALRDELARVRQQGYAVAIGEISSEISAISAPVFDHTDNVVAALAVNGPSFRFTADVIARIAPDVQRAADQISAALGARSRRTDPALAAAR